MFLNTAKADTLWRFLDILLAVLPVLAASPVLSSCWCSMFISSARTSAKGCAPLALVLADARPPALPACAPDALVLAEARPPELLALAPFALVRADARPSTLLVYAPLALVLADASAPALLASA